jgi:hypothetical protein
MPIGWRATLALLPMGVLEPTAYTLTPRPRVHVTTRSFRDAPLAQRARRDEQRVDVCDDGLGRLGHERFLAFLSIRVLRPRRDVEVRQRRCGDLRGVLLKQLGGGAEADIVDLFPVGQNERPLELRVAQQLVPFVQPPDRDADAVRQLEVVPRHRLDDLGLVRLVVVLAVDRVEDLRGEAELAGGFVGVGRGDHGVGGELRVGVHLCDRQHLRRVLCLLRDREPLLGLPLERRVRRRKVLHPRADGSLGDVGGGAVRSVVAGTTTARHDGFDKISW